MSDKQTSSAAEALLQSAQAPRITAREQEILSLIAEGLTDQQIAARLWVSRSTVHTHLVHLREKLQVHNRVALVREAGRFGLISQKSTVLWIGEEQRPGYTQGQQPNPPLLSLSSTTGDSGGDISENDEREIAMLNPRLHFWHLAALLAVGSQNHPCLAEPANSAGAPHAPATTEVSNAGMDPQQLARIPARMKEFVDQGTMAGAVTLVARHGVVVSLEAVGYQDLETRKPMRADTIFQIRDLTKPLTAVGIMMLLEEGRLLLSDPVEKYVPEFREQLVIDSREGAKVLATKHPSRPITIRDLLTHTSGLSNDAASNKTLAADVADFSKQPLEFEPGTRYLHSSQGIATLGRIIEVVSAQPYEKFVEKRILRPLGMKDSFFFPPADKYDRIASVYRLKNGKLMRTGGSQTPDWQRQGAESYRQSMKYARPSDGMFSTAADLAAFYQMMLNRGAYNGVRMLSQASVEAMTTLQTGELPTDGVGIGSGLGWGVVRKSLSSAAFASMGSYGQGAPTRGTLGHLDPKRGLVAVFMEQRFVGDWDEACAFMDMAYAAIVD